MNLPRALSIGKWLLALGTLGLVLAAAFAVNRWVRTQQVGESGGAEIPKRGSGGVVKLGAQLAASHGIQDEPARALAWTPRTLAYGRVVNNPQATTEIRSPFAGTLRAPPDGVWPVPGRRVEARQVIGLVDIRVSPQERLELQAKYNESRLKLEGAAEQVRIHQETVARLQKAAVSEVVSRRVLDDALVALAEARTQVATAKAGVELWQQALKVIERGNERPDSAWTEPLVAPTAGEVTAWYARPGTAIEPGGLLARIVDFQRPLVRLDLPPEALAGGPPAQVSLVAPATSAPLSDGGAPPEADARASATVVGPAPAVEVASQRVSYWYEVHLPPVASGKTAARPPTGAAVLWRPGLFVQASLQLPGREPQAAVTVARAAVLFHQGRALVYVRLAPGRYERREVRILGEQDERWVLAAGVAAGEAVVWRQAQVLLSEEFRGDVDND